MSEETSIIYVDVQGKWGEMDYDDDEFELIYVTTDNKSLDHNDKLSSIMVKESTSTSTSLIYQPTKNTLSTT